MSLLATEQNLLDGLNDSQRNAVRETQGRVLVLAGAGAGKTKVLTTRAVYLMAQRVDPWHILAITFTNKAAKEIKARVHAMNSQGFKCWIGTFHSVCSRILNTHAHLLGNDKFTHMSESDIKSTIKQAAVQLGLEVDKNMIYNLGSQISLWKSDMITPGEAQSMTHGNKDKSSAANVFERYEALKERNLYYDYDDLLLKTVHLFRTNPELLGRYQNTFRYIMIDEFQDTNKVQFEIIEMLGGKHKNIFLVGDPDQSIYSFRSAKIENILKYQQLHPDTKLITLKENYRSTQNIVDASNALVHHNKMRLDREAFSVGKKGDSIHVFRFNDAGREADFIARLIVNIRKTERRDWSDFAILYRMNNHSKHLELAFRDENIPYKIVGSISFYDRKEIKDLISYLRACHNSYDDIAVKNIINVPKRAIGETTVKKIEQFAQERNIPFFTALQNIDEVAAASKINKGTVTKIKEFVSIIESVSKVTETGEFAAANLMKVLLSKTGFMGQFDPEKEEDEARIENVTHLRDYAQHWDMKEDKELNTLGQFLSEISLDGDREDVDGDDFVTLTSTHSAKGLEWKQVFVAGLEDNVFPHFRSKSKASDLEEERRLFYVAMTRAAERLFLTYSAYKFEYGSQKPIKQNPSPYIDEIPHQYKRVMIQKA